VVYLPNGATLYVALSAYAGWRVCPPIAGMAHTGGLSADDAVPDFLDEMEAQNVLDAWLVDYAEREQTDHTQSAPFTGELAGVAPHGVRAVFAEKRSIGPSWEPSGP
jgi:hypothetical protein